MVKPVRRASDQQSFRLITNHFWLIIHTHTHCCLPNLYLYYICNLSTHTLLLAKLYLYLYCICNYPHTHTAVCQIVFTLLNFACRPSHLELVGALSVAMRSMSIAFQSFSLILGTTGTQVLEAILYCFSPVYIAGTNVLLKQVLKDIYAALS